MVLPLVMNSAMPAAADMVASVATNGCTRPYVASTPLSSPIAAPSSKPTMRATTNGIPTVLYSHAVNIIVSAMTAATDRSIPPTRMTRKAPAAMIPMSAIWAMMLVRFVTVRKNGDRNDSTMIMMMSPAMGPPSRFNRLSICPASP
jgi:hypothetical protein